MIGFTPPWKCLLKTYYICVRLSIQAELGASFMIVLNLSKAS